MNEKNAWSEDFEEVKEGLSRTSNALFKGKYRIVTYLIIAILIILIALFTLNNLNKAPKPEETPSPSPTQTATPSPTPSATPIPTETPAPIPVSTTVRNALPAAWVRSENNSCKEYWVGNPGSLSSIIVLDKGKTVLTEEGYNVSSAYSENSLTLTATAEDLEFGSITIYFSLENFTLCFN